MINNLQSDFSTTDDFYKIISTSAIMTTFKTYFEYVRFMCGCGINNVFLKGTASDWEKIMNKAGRLAQYDNGDGVLIKYISHISIILNNIHNSINGNVDVLWWNSLINSESRNTGSMGGGKFIKTDDFVGIPDETKITGWILHFYGEYNSIILEELKPMSFVVPVKVINEHTRLEKMMEMESKFSSVCKIDECIYSPRLQIKILEKSRKTF